MRPHRTKSSPQIDALAGAVAAAPASRVLIVDDDPQLPLAFARILRANGFAVEQASDGSEAAAAIARGGFDVVLSDIDMPRLDGIGLLRAVRLFDAELPVVLITASPAVETAIAALDNGAVRYLVKPVPAAELVRAVTQAAQLRKMAMLRREAASLAASRANVDDRAALDARFSRALDSLWMAYQPIVAFGARRLHAFEALVRSSEPDLAGPAALFDAAEKLERLADVGRRIRARVAEAAAGRSELLFVNLHPRDLADEELFDAAAPLSRVAPRVVLEITERVALDHVADVRVRIARLRALGYRVAVDDLGAGYAGLSSFAQLEPEVAKIDMSLVRDIDRHPTKRTLVRAMAALCGELGIALVVEGVETAAERDTLVELGCELMQGYLFARPAPLSSLPPINW
jgi:EAL domain-containing protein (putative c-di-GMP-specific phosphodiesterase class I)